MIQNLQVMVPFNVKSFFTSVCVLGAVQAVLQKLAREQDLADCKMIDSSTPLLSYRKLWDQLSRK